ncbi:hypothetical protein FKM82_006633 [Ascaphus truei]
MAPIEEIEEHVLLDSMNRTAIHFLPFPRPTADMGAQ